jgi:DNA-binding IclR family transcriptional regulator
MEKLWSETLKRLSPDTSLFKVLIYLSFKGKSKPSEIVEGTQLPAGTVRPALRSLLEMGLATQDEDGSYLSKVSFTEIMSDVYRRLPKE